MPATLASMSSTHHGSPTPLEAVLSRLHGSSGFPTLSSTISDINRVVASESHSTQQITQVILRDVSLTTKLLQVVNSASYGQFGGRIRTVSRAVLILGGDVVRNVAMTLMMLGFSKGRPQEKSLQDELIGAFFAGVVSGALCRRLGIPNSEEAVICTWQFSIIYGVNGYHSPEIAPQKTPIGLRCKRSSHNLHALFKGSLVVENL
jgi:hypothetical protein